MDEYVTVYVDEHGGAWVITRWNDRLIERYLPSIDMKDDFQAIIPTVEAVNELVKRTYMKVARLTGYDQWAADWLRDAAKATREWEKAGRVVNTLDRWISSGEAAHPAKRYSLRPVVDEKFWDWARRYVDFSGNRELRLGIRNIGDTLANGLADVLRAEMSKAERRAKIDTGANGK